ncbi:hypothetical protein M404DRAFT_78798, partial [Pisolithus tinctorius Marx 270]
DLILGTPFLYQHKIMVGLHSPRVVVGSVLPTEMKGAQVSTLESRATEVYNDNLEKARKYLQELAKPLCSQAGATALPPFRAINHEIPLIDEKKVYHWRPSKCPDAMRHLWTEKKNAYLKTGRWELTAARNTCPMMLIPKAGNPPRLRVVVDLRERNKNTRKLSSPMPDMDGILRRVAKKPYRSIIDGADAYEQIRVVPEHVERTAVTTPDGNMVSLVVQQGDCNAPATYQALMNHIFGEYIGSFMDVYLDDIIIYSDTLEEHVRHVKTVLEILTREKLYLSEKKLKFLSDEVKILGRVVTDDGIKMDPDKVDRILNWKVPTNRTLCKGFIGSVGYLADDIYKVRVPLGVLAEASAETRPFRWTFTEQRAFETVKRYVAACAQHCRVPLDYGPDRDPIWVMTDACGNGIGGVVAQGEDWKSAKVAAFYSAKMSSAQRNYPVHEQELLAGVETMLRHRDILQGVHFTWVTDHKSLTYLLDQKDLSGRQARWLEKLAEFDFEIKYVPGEENVLPDALSRMYEFDAPGTIRAHSEYLHHDLDVEEYRSTPVMDPIPPVDEGVEVETPTKDQPERSGKGTLRRHRAPTPPAETGRPETGIEFARRVKDRFVLLGPGERKKGGKGSGPPPPITNEHAANALSDTQTPSPNARDPDDTNMTGITKTSLVPLVMYPGNEGVLKAAKNRYGEDPFFKQILSDPKAFKNFEITPEGFIRLKLPDRTVFCVPDIAVNDKRLRETVIDQAHSILAHLGARKTVSYIREFLWWDSMVKDITAYCTSCQTCQRSKPPTHKPFGLLNPLSVPSRPWEAIGIDFVGPLPESKDRDGEYDSITVIIDLLTSMVHIVPSRTTYTAREVAELMFAEVYKHHGLPRAIVSDRDVLFTSTFWKRLNELIGIKQKMSSAYHPETDGATERANRTIAQMLRCCIGPNQKDWVSRLPAIEFAINNATSESTGYAPFFLNTGQMPRRMIWDAPTRDEYPSVRAFANKMKLTLLDAHDAILKARMKQTVGANKKRRVCPFVTGDLVYVSTKNISLSKGTSRKLVPKFIGPYRISDDFGNNSYRVKLPDNLKQRGIHDVFHSSLLRVHIPNDDRKFPGRKDDQIPELGGTSREWAVDQIINHRGSRSEATFEVQWTAGDRTWLPFDEVAHLKALADYFEALGIDGINELREKGDGGSSEDDPQV